MSNSFFQLHDELDDVERVRADLFDERGAAGNLFFIVGEVLAYDVDDTLLTDTVRPSGWW